MANYLNDLTKGLVTGLQGIAGGFVEKGWRDNAEELFKQGQNYLTQMGLQQRNYIKQGEEILKSVDPSQQVEVGNRQTTEVGGDPTGQVQQIQGMEVNPNTVQSNPVQNSVRTQRGLEDLYRGYFNVQGQLANNPYGKGFATSLEGMYKAQQPEYKEYGDKLYKITPSGAEVVANTGKLKRDVINTSRRVIKDGEDYFAQYDVVITDPDGTQKIEKLASKLDPTVGAEEYDYQNLGKFNTTQEKSDIQLNKQIAFKNYVAQNYPNSGRGNRSGLIQKLNLVQADKKSELKSYLNNSNDFNAKWGSWNNVPKGYDDRKKFEADQKKLLEQQQLLINKGISKEDLAEYLGGYVSGDINDKDLTVGVSKQDKETEKKLKLINEATDMTWKHPKYNMNQWVADLHNAPNAQELTNVFNWYVNQYNNAILPSNLKDEVKAELWSRFQREYDKIRKQKGW